MHAARRADYLRALGIDVWVSRAAAGAESFRGLIVGPGSGRTLVICAGASEAASALAADIARSLDSEPVWGWIAEEDGDPGAPLELVVAEHGFDRILLLGDELLHWILENGPAAGNVQAIGSARLVVARSISELERDGSARQALWRELTSRKWCGRRTRGTGQ